METGDAIKALNEAQKESFKMIFETMASTNTRIDFVEGEIGSIKNDTASLKSNVGVLQEDTASLKLSVGVLQEDMASLKSSVGVLQADTASLKSSMRHLEKDVTSIKSSTEEVKADLNEVKNELIRLWDSVERLITSVRNNQALYIIPS